jgi:hypothetical protein
MTMRKAVLVLMMALLIGLTDWAALAQSQATKPSEKTAVLKKPAVPEISALSPVRIECASLLSEGELALDARLAIDLNREFRGRDYDNVRLAPLGVRYVFSKLELNEYAALQVGLTFAGDEDVFPYPNDGLDLFVNLPLQRKMGEGLLYGEFGYTVQGGDLDTNDYFNFGLGYAFPVAKEVSLNVELAGEEGQYGTSWNNTLDLMLGANFVAERLRIAPFVTFGLYDASPDFSLGSTLEVRF